jgi:hypothetical protein
MSSSSWQKIWYIGTDTHTHRLTYKGVIYTITGTQEDGRAVKTIPEPIQILLSVETNR